MDFVSAAFYIESAAVAAYLFAYLVRENAKSEREIRRLRRKVSRTS